MSRQLSRVKLPLAACLAATLAWSSRADTGKLVSNSPFLPPRAAAPAAPQAQQEELEFGGVTVLAGRPLLSIENKSTQRGYWLGVGESRDGITVVDYDAARSLATVEAGGRRRELRLRIATAAAPSAVAQAPAAQAPARPPSVPAPRVAAPAATAAVGPPVAPVPASTPAAQIQPLTRQEAEAENARAFVQDLLEMQQRHRRRMEEARRLPEGQMPPPAEKSAP